MGASLPPGCTQELYSVFVAVTGSHPFALLSLHYLSRRDREFSFIVAEIETYVKIYASGASHVLLAFLPNGGFILSVSVGYHYNGNTLYRNHDFHSSTTWPGPHIL